jgi:ssDNA-binding Zn-finger/Zn-ribbon topoisomerase 1
LNQKDENRDKKKRKKCVKDILVRRHEVEVEFLGREHIPTKRVAVEKCDHEVCQLLLFLH